MKKYISYIGLAILSTILFSCNKDSFNYPEGTVGISKITNYAVFTLAGDEVMSVVKGTTFTDPGATAKEGSNSLKVAVSGTVNTNAVGLYIINYSAVNKDGFSASASRTVVVIPSADNGGVDISGKYDYAAGGYTATMTKVAPGVYYVSSLYSAATILPAYLICLDGTHITVPLQTTGFGRLQGTALLSGSASGSTLNYTIDLPDQGITGTTRKWLKH